MSVKIMSQVWDFGPSDRSEAFVLLAIADFCNDDGECWPAVASIAQKSRMTERGVQKVFSRLVEDGWLEIDQRKGRFGCNLYRVKTPNRVHPQATQDPEPGSPPNPVHPEPGSENPEPRSKNPEPGSGEPLEPLEPSVSNNAREILATLTEWCGDEAARSFIAYRRKQKGKALTLTAAKRLANQLCTIFQSGGDPDDALGMAEERGWQSVQADWYFNAKGKSNDYRTPSHGGYAERPGNRPDPALEQISRLA